MSWFDTAAAEAASGVAPLETNCGLSGALWAMKWFPEISIFLLTSKMRLTVAPRLHSMNETCIHASCVRDPVQHTISNKRRIHLGKIISASKERLKKTNKKIIFLMGLCCSCFNFKKPVSSHIIILMITFVFHSYWQRNEIPSKCVNKSTLQS